MLCLLTISVGCTSRNPYVTGGIIDMQQSRYQSAEEQFKKALELEPTNSDAHLWLGKCYASQRKYSNAASEFDEAMSINPGHQSDIDKEPYFFWAIYYNAGIEFVEEENWEPAEKSLKRAIEILPDSIAPYTQLSYAYTRQDRGLDAENTLRTAMEKAPQNMAVRVSLARLKIKDKEYEEARALLEEVTDKDSENSKAYYYLGLVYSNMKDGESGDVKYAEKAEEAFAQAAALDSTDRDAFFNLAFTRMSLKKYAEAVESFRGVVELEPKDKEAWLYLGMCYYQVKNYDLAIDSFDHVIALDPNNGDAYIQRGYAKKEKGLSDEAYKDIEYGNKLNRGQ